MGNKIIKKRFKYPDDYDACFYTFHQTFWEYKKGDFDYHKSLGQRIKILNDEILSLKSKLNVQKGSNLTNAGLDKLVADKPRFERMKFLDVSVLKKCAEWSKSEMKGSLENSTLLIKESYESELLNFKKRYWDKTDIPILDVTKLYNVTTKPKLFCVIPDTNVLISQWTNFFNDCKKRGILCLISGTVSEELEKLNKANLRHKEMNNIRSVISELTEIYFTSSTNNQYIQRAEHQNIISHYRAPFIKNYWPNDSVYKVKDASIFDTYTFYRMASTLPVVLITNDKRFKMISNHFNYSCFIDLDAWNLMTQDDAKIYRDLKWFNPKNYIF
jgi:hypothetical protein